MENTGREAGGAPDLPVTGEVVLEAYFEDVNKKQLNSLVRSVVRRLLVEDAPGLEWASYLVVVSAGRDFDEVRCQVDIETSADFAGFAIGYGASPALAFHDAMGRMQWCDRNNTARISG